MKSSTSAFGALALCAAFALTFLGCEQKGVGEPAPPTDTPAAEPEPTSDLASHALSHPGYTRDLDGTPVRGEYTMEIQVGTPSQAFRVVMDSGSSNLILLGDSSVCDNCGTEPGKQYSPASSSTSQDRNRTYTIQYGSGSLDATEYSDTVGLPGGESFNYTFGVMTHDANVPNILGLAYAALAEGGLKPWFDELVSHTGMSDEFSMLMCGPEKGGRIELGGHSVEPTSYLEVTEERWYVVEPDDLSVKGGDVLGTFHGWQTIVDSGTTELIVPPDIYDGILREIDAGAGAAGLEVVPVQGGGYAVEGDPGRFSELPTFQVSAGNDTYDIAPSSYLTPIGRHDGEPTYLVAVAPATTASGAILGQVFMSNFYTVFDRESTPNRVGFAPVGDLCD